MNILSRVSTGISITIFAACFAAFLLFGLTGTGWKALTIPTGSMRPSMPPGSLALVHRVPGSSLKVGDVITYDNPLRHGTTLSHRITKKYFIDSKILSFVTKGDANRIVDVPIVAGNVQGKVVAHVPYVGSWLLWAKTWAGLAVLVYVPAALIAIEEIWRLNSYYKSLEPYRLLGYRLMPSREPNPAAKKLALGMSVVLVTIFVAGVVAPRVDALLVSNTVSLRPNTISVVASNAGGGTGNCSGNTTNNNSVTVNNTSTQTATSGDATVSGNTTGGSAMSGSASNSNSTTVNITVNNCH